VTALAHNPFENEEHASEITGSSLATVGDGRVKLPYSIDDQGTSLRINLHEQVARAAVTAR